MKKYKVLKLLSLLLAVLMLLACFPMAAIAATLDNVASTVIEETESQSTYEDMTEVALDETEKDIYILAEDTTKRGEFEKHYLCSDGTFVAVTYAEAVHYLNDNGEWIDIDNSLALNTAEGVYEAENGDFKISFHNPAQSLGATVASVSGAETTAIEGGTVTLQPIQTQPESLITLTKGNQILSWTLKANKNITVEGDAQIAGTTNIEQTVSTLTVDSSVTLDVKGEIKSDTQTETAFTKKNVKDEDAFYLPKVSNQVQYESLFGADEGVFVRYTAYRNKIEEDIFIERETDIESFSMVVDCGGFTPVLNSDNSIDFLDADGEMAYHISIPYMVDAVYAVLNDIETTLTVKGDQCIITYTPNSEWLNSPDRVYPIMLDPSVTTNEYRSNVSDTYVKEGDTVDHSDEQYLDISFGSVAIISFTNLPVIHESMPVQKAVINFTLSFAQFNETPIYLEARTTDVSVDNMTYSEYVDSSLKHTMYSYMLPNSTLIIFDWTLNYYDIYQSRKNTIFAVRLNESNNNYYYYPICSSENTSGAGPYMAITYGYAFEDEFNTGDLLSFKNFDNGRYIYVGTTPNAAAQTTTNSINLALVKNEDTDGYKIRSMSNLSLHLTVNDTGGLIWSSDDIPERQEWLFVPTANWTFYIVLRGDMSKALAITDVGYYMNGQWNIVGGNLVFDQINGYNCPYCDGNHQEWVLYRDGEQVTTDLGGAYFETGTYYINNVGYGGMLTSSRKLETGFSSVLGDNIKWIITNIGNKQYTIQPYTRLPYLLSCSSSGSITLARKEGIVTDDCIWEFQEFMITPTLLSIRNKATGLYMYYDGTNLITDDERTNYVSHRWRIISKDLYNDVTTSNVSFADLVIPMDSSANVSITASNGASFVSSVYDFEYTVTSGAANVSVSSDGKVTGLKSGDATVKATHKTTGAEVWFNIDVYKFLAGNYFLLKNKETKKYIQPHMYGSNYIVQQSFSNLEDQLWELVYYGGGYYKIRNKGTGLYLTAPAATSSGVNVFQSAWTDSSSSRQLWKFTELSNGMHKIQSMSHEGTNLCLSVTDSPIDSYANGVNIQQKIYTNDSDYKDEWWIGENYTYIEFSFDHKFVEIHRTSTETFAMAEERLSNIILNQVFPIIKNAYLQLYGIEFKNTQTRVPLYTSDADACPNKDANGHCVCITEAECNLDDEASPLANNNVNGFEKDSHCDSAIRLRNNLITNIPENTIRISFTGYVFCFYDSDKNTHGYNTVAGLSSYSHPTIIINQKIDDDPRHFILVIAHEIAHSYGVEIHHEEDDSTESCIMTKGRKFYGTISPLTNYSEYFCTSCESCIASNRYKWR